MVISNRIGSDVTQSSKNQKILQSRTPTKIGEDYEGYLAMLFILRGAINKYRYKVGVQIDQAYKFDDLLFLYERGGKRYSRCLQAKHTTEKKKIDSMNLLTIEQSDFSLVKYFFSFKDMTREDYFRDITQDQLIVYTNFQLNVDSSIGSKMKLSELWQPFESIKINDKICKLIHLLEQVNDSDNLLDVNKNDSQRYRFNKEFVQMLKSKANEYNITRLAQAFKDWLTGKKVLKDVECFIRPYWKFLTEEVLDATDKKIREDFLQAEKKHLSKEAKIFHKKLLEDMDRKNKQNVKKKHQNNELTLDILNKMAGKIEEYPTWEVDVHIRFDDVIKIEEIESFLGLFVMAVCQPNHSELKEIIKADIRQDQYRKYGGDDFYTEDDIDRYVEEIFNHFHADVFKWKDSETDRKKRNNKVTKECYMSDENGKQFLQNQWKEVKFDVRQPVTSFTGRDYELEALHANICRGKTVKSQTRVICGAPGMGKTELIRGYIQKNSRRYENKVLWIDGRSSESIEN
ncbi:uncharacterized protein LOC143918993 [Arctopsyche grandis]|uniref:uncharacterized protein LOC143918993 n=1 Tax=Arctopsyche grandis TaxID=121162 RepID=UPI00406DA109